MAKDSRKLAVFFPGIGYTVDKPLMYYSRKIAANAGYEIRLLPYSGFPDKILGDKNRMLESYNIALKQAEEMLADIDFADYDEILLIGKSIGTVVAAEMSVQMATRISAPVRFILYTPLEETFQYPLEDAIVFTGLDDPWVGRENSKIVTLCIERNIPFMPVAFANHSLETGDIQGDIFNLQSIMKRTEEFVKKGAVTEQEQHTGATAT